MFVKGLAIGFALAATATVAIGALYRWVDENGRVQYSDTPPDKKGAVQLSNRGIVLKKVDALTPEQQKAKDIEEARKRADEAKAAEQRRQDTALLQSFTTVQEIDMKRDREVQALEITIANLREQERTISARQAGDRKRAEQLEKGKKPLPDGFKEDQARADGERKVIEDEIKRRYDDIGATRARYDALKKRYIALRQDAAMVEPASAVIPAVPAKR